MKNMPKTSKHQKYVKNLAYEKKLLVDECYTRFGGDWDKYLIWLSDRLSIKNLNWRLRDNTKVDIPRAKNLQEYERKHKVRLGNYPLWVCD